MADKKKRKKKSRGRTHSGPGPKQAAGNGGVAFQRRAPQPAADPDRSRPGPGVLLGFAFVLALAVVLVYADVRNHQFVMFDDPLYVTENLNVIAGLSAEGIRWAFTTGHDANWQPLTWLSLMLDAELFGLNPGAFHLTNLTFHVMNVLLLFLLIWRMTGQLWASAAVAALFGLHPLRVESVAWVTERKDVLCVFFWLLATLAYLRYLERRSPLRYLLIAVCLALGLMAKPMLVSFPCVLLLLDYWPLGRYSFAPEPEVGPSLESRDPGFQNRQDFGQLVREKIPLFLLVALSSVVTFIVQQRGAAVGSMEDYPLSIRIANAAVAYTGYLEKTIWPVDLTAFYPHDIEALDLMQVAGSGVFLLGLTGFVFYRRRREPFLLVGWLWYLGTLVPVIGLVQVGQQSMADRYTYIPHIGLFIMAVWLLFSLSSRRRRGPLPAILIAVVLVPLAVLTRAQVQTWKNAIALNQHALSINPDNYKAHHNIGVGLVLLGNYEQAVGHFKRSAALKPTANRLYNLANAFRVLDRSQEAIENYLKALELDPSYVIARVHVGGLYTLQNDYGKAAYHYKRVIEIEPLVAGHHKNLGVVYFRSQQYRLAIEEYSEAFQLNPNDRESREMVADLRRRMGY